jgi:hypothetical protein
MTQGLDDAIGGLEKELGYMANSLGELSQIAEAINNLSTSMDAVADQLKWAGVGGIDQFTSTMLEAARIIAGGDDA